MITKQTKIILISTVVVVVCVAVAAAVLVVYFNKSDSSSEVLGCEIFPYTEALHPIIVLAGTTNFIYPKWGEKTLKFNSSQAVDFICPNRFLVFNNIHQNHSLLSGTCASGLTFNIGNRQVNWTDVKCSSFAWRDIRHTGKTCATDGEELEAGYEVEDGRFLNTLTICFNTAMQIAYYTFINQTASINQQALSTPRPSWLQGNRTYTIGTVTNLYIRRNQKATINRLLGLPVNSTFYIEDSSNFFLARGHLTARSDCFYAVQQNATFYMQNIAPQWQTFNGYNWNQIEIDVRDYASDNGVDLQVWTGVHGVTTLPHNVTGEPVELYLYVNGTRKALPVPEIFWKVAYNPLTEKGVALIGVNNPYNSTFKPLCFDVSNRITWLHCNKSSQQMGFCYACSITTLKYVVTSIPDISDRGLLL